MMTPFAGTIVLWPLNWAPYGWYFCQGQSLQVQQYQLLYAIIGNIYGGDTTKFNLPNLVSRVQMGVGQNAIPSIPYVGLKETGGTTSAAIAIPQHTHSAGGTLTATLSVNNTSANKPEPSATAAIAAGMKNATALNAYSPTTTPTPVDIGQLALTAPTFPSVTGGSCGNAQGGANSFGTMPPVQMLNYIICWNGEYPPFQ